jgi:DNA-binding LacI/PurR family transcriptional regulator
MVDPLAGDNVPTAAHRTNIYDVARLAGVSHMTVSRVINGSGAVSEATRARVLEVITQTSWARSSIARALATKRGMRIGVVVDGAGEFGPSSTLRALEAAARREGYLISVFTVTQGSREEIDNGVDELVGDAVDALCVIAPRRSSLEGLEGRSRGLPTLVIGSGKYRRSPAVAVSQRKAGHRPPDLTRTYQDRAPGGASGLVSCASARARLAGADSAARP